MADEKRPIEDLKEEVNLDLKVDEASSGDDSVAEDPDSKERSAAPAEKVAGGTLVQRESGDSGSAAGSGAGSGRALVDPVSLFASLIARIVVGCFFFFTFIIGMWIAGTSLHDPDTCWLLGVGAWIAQHGAVPMTDPFSYTMGDRPFVAYQWLTELLFFASYKLFSGYGLVALTNLIVVFAFIIIPLGLFQRWKSSMWAGVAICTLAVMAGSFHFLARPEIITYLFLSIWFALLAGLRQSVSDGAAARSGGSAVSGDASSDVGGAKPAGRGVDWRVAGSFAMLMMLWANMHSGFVLALIALATFVLVNTIEFAVRKLPLPVLATSWAALILSLVATLLNPRGFGLWQYLPNQLFFTGFNKYIVELKPLGVFGLFEPEFLPALVLVVCAIAAQVWDLRRSALAAKDGANLPAGIAFSPIFTIAAFVSGTIARRMIPFSCVFLACELAWLLRGTGKTAIGASALDDAGIGGSGKGVQESPANRPWWQEVSDKVGNLLASGRWRGYVIALSLVGVLVTSTRITAPNVPQGTEGTFDPPFMALQFISKLAPDGKCLNDPQYGDMMIWYLHSDVKPLLVEDPLRLPDFEKQPKVFIDTRFDMHGSALVDDYNTIAHTLPGWKERFAKYNFDWVFVPSNWKIANALRDEGWKTVFDDKRAVVLVRPDSNGAKPGNGNTESSGSNTGSTNEEVGREK